MWVAWLVEVISAGFVVGAVLLMKTSAFGWRFCRLFSRWICRVEDAVGCFVGTSAGLS
jgi:hypothetical protein